MQMDDGLIEQTWRVVESCVADGASPEELVKEVRNAWGQAIRDKEQRDDKVFAKMLGVL